MELLSILIGVIVLLVALAIQKLLKLRAYIESFGVPIDNQTPFFKQNYVFLKHDVKCLQKYGTVWAKLEGTTPVLVVAEPDLVKEIMVKKFDKFTNHVDVGAEERHLTVFDAQDEKWKQLRKALSPTFTSGKLKGMFDHVDVVADNMIRCLQHKMDEAPGCDINVKEVFQGFSLDAISNCAFGIDTNSFKNPGNELFQRCLGAFSDIHIKSHLENLAMTVMEYFPFLFNYLDAYGKDNYDYLNKVTKDVLDSRPDASRGDFIDRIKEMLEQLKSPESSHLLSEENIIAQGSAFFVAGFETSSNTMSTLTYNLAKHPEIQECIAQEVKTVLEDFDGKINYDTINHMPYLEAALQENLRMHSPGLRLDRVCSEDCEVGPYKIKKGTLVYFPFHAMHYNPKYFPEPEKFQPERFLKPNDSEIVPFSYIPFGGGPRVCIGQRFAMIEMKIAMAKLLAKFKIVATPATSLHPLKGSPFLFSYKDVLVKLEPRTF